MGKKKSTSAIINYTPGKGYKVRLRGKRLANKISLYLDYYNGYSKTEDGKIKTRRKLEYLKYYLYSNPRTEKERTENNETLELALSIRNKRESDINHNSEGLIAPYRKKTNFFDYCQAFIDEYRKKDIRMVKTAVNQFKEFTKEKYLTPVQINEKIIIGYRDYLLEKYNGEGPHSIFARFKKILKAATKEGLFTTNPAHEITCPVPDGISKSILMPEEIIKLAQTPCGNSEVKRAFLFSLNTGLRFVDIVDLKYSHIISGKVEKSQQKTGKKVNIYLNQTALKLIGEHGKPDKYVFTLPSFTSCLKTLKNWAAKAEIKKNITWHSARHSFATALLINKTDIKTVGTLLGHSKLDHTQKYLHVVDELSKKAVDGLPEINI